MLVLSRLSTARPVKCPGCSQDIFLAHPNQNDPGQRTRWLPDGAPFPELDRLLTHEQRALGDHHTSMRSGRCGRCGRTYQVAIVAMMDSTGPAASARQGYLRGECNRGPVRNFTCRLHGDSRMHAWMLHAHVTPAGLLHEHVSRPWLLGAEPKVYGHSPGGDALSAQSAAHQFHLAWDGLHACFQEECR
jgi:hypothetical protein